MKKICSLLIMLLCVGVSASAFSKTKLYVNPGHGGYTSNDRQTSMPSVNGVKLPVGDNGYNKSNCFWESSGNTYRALGIKYFWTKRVNSNIKLSRSSNTQDGDLSLSTIASNSNSYGGYFMSLHTNAGNASANYMIVMYSATSSSNPSGERVSGSKKMATAAAKWHDAVNLTSETYDTPRAMTDRSFYGGSSLGVLRTNNAPGYLAESWFHDYRPEAFRMCSEGYNYFLAWQLMRAYLESPAYSGIQIYPIIVGDIRDLSKSCGYTSYTTRGRDKYLAINGATVTLKNVATGGTKTYTTDQFNNGFYTFYDCVYGATYEITVSKAGYKDVTKTITVGTTDTQHKLNFDLEEGTNSGITVSPTSVDFGEITAETTATKSVTVKGTDLSSTIAVSSSNTTEFAISATSLAKTGGTLTITYKPSAAGSHSTTITLTSGSHKKTLVVSGSAKNPPLTFTEVWNFSETSGKAPSTGANWASDKASIRNFAFGAGKLYVVSASEGKIYIVKAQTGEKLGELDMTGVAGGALNVVDVNYVDGKIIACNIATNAEATNTLKVYVWDNDKATPRVLLETTNIGGTVRLGDTFNLQGDLTNGALFFAEGKADTDTKVVSYTITNGIASTTPTVLTVTDDGTTGVQFGLSPRVIPEANGKFWCVGQNFYPTLFDPEGIMEASLNAEALNNECAGNTFKAFTFKGTTYGLATTYEPNSTSSERLRKGRIVLLDGSAGWAAASNVGEYPSAGLGTTRNTSMSSGVEVAVNGTAGVEMWVLVHNQGIAYYKHGTAPTYTYTDPTDPYVSASVSALSFNTTEGYDDAKSLTISGERLTGNINLALSGSNANQFKLSTTSIAQSSGKASATVTVTYDPTAIGSHTATLTITSDGAVAQSVALSGTCSANTVFNDNVTALEEVWNYSQVSNKTADWVSYGTQVNNDIAVANGKLYAVYRVDNSNNQIYVVDAY
ncbi:MAG: choice-of-anchor D domain-containing protein, partial [Muribaculaceae bacterium]|nr:choice-of-anchor D domain-containing protein [Muribaculaceae bacterium]